MNNGFNYFPERLFSKPVKMLNIAANFFGMSKPQEIFYSIKDGNWSDISVWETVSGRPGKLPTANDDVYVRHTVTLNAGTTAIPVQVNNFFVSGTFKADNSSRVIWVNGNINSTGMVDFTGSNVNLILYGVNNYIVNFTAGTASTINYARLGDQQIMNLLYKHLTLSGGGTKSATNYLNITGNLFLSQSSNYSVTLELGNYDLFVGGTSTVGSSTVYGTAGAALSKQGAGSIVLAGKITLFNNQLNKFDFSGNPTVECRGGMDFTNNSHLVFGTGQWKFTTNNQSITGIGTNNVTFPTQVIIDNIILTTATGTGLAAVSFMINPSGTTSGSTLKNTGGLNIYEDPNNVMLTGIFDVSTSGGMLTFYYDGNYTLPKTTFGNNLTLAGIGTKTALGNSTFNNLYISAYTVFDLSTFDMTVNGITEIDSLSVTGYPFGTLQKTTPGNILFIGKLYIPNGLSSTNTGINFSGNPTVECRGGIDITNGSYANYGTGVWTFSTNNQSIKLTGNSTVMDINAIISGAITVTAGTAFITGTVGFRLLSIDGNNAASTLANGYIIEYQGTIRPMVTGVLQTNAADNTFKYNMLGDQDVKGGTYRKLEFGGSGIKTLQGNVVVNVTAGGSWSITGSASINYNGYTITTI